MFNFNELILEPDTDIALVKTKLLRGDLPNRGILQKITRSPDCLRENKNHTRNHLICQPSLGHLKNASKG